MKKKLLCLLLCLMMLLSFGATAALAATDVSLVVDAVSSSVAAGGTVSLTIKLSNPNGKAINGAAVQLTVPSEMTYVSSKLGGNFLFENYNSSAAKLDCTVSGKGTVNEDGSTTADLNSCGKGITDKEITLATVTYKVDTSVAAGTKLTVSAEMDEVFDAGATDLLGGNSTASLSVTVGLDTPVLSSVTNGSNGVTVKWKAVDGASNYSVWYKVSGGSWTKAGSTTKTSYTVGGLTIGKTYYFTVRCDSSSGKAVSKFDTKGLSITYYAYATPTLVSVSANNSNGATVKWKAVSGVSNYSVWYKKGSGSWTKAGTSTGTSYTVKDLTVGSTYSFTVRCIDAAGKNIRGFDSIGISLKLLANPKVSSVSNTSAGVSVKWGTVSGATNYSVWYKVSGGSWTKAGTTTGTNYTVKGLTSGKTYSFTVRCVDAAGNNTSGFDTTGKSIAYVAAPTISSLTNVNGGVTVKWGAEAGAVNYTVFYKSSGGSWTKAGTSTGTSYTVKGLTSGKSYTFTVRCTSADGTGYTSGYNSTGKSITYLSVPKLLTPVKTDSGIQVKWEAVTGAENYSVWYKVSGGSWKKAGTSTGTSYTVTGLTAGKTYAFTVRCVSADGKTNTSAYNTTGKTLAY